MHFELKRPQNGKKGRSFQKKINEGSCVVYVAFSLSLVLYLDEEGIWIHFIGSQGHWTAATHGNGRPDHHTLFTYLAEYLFSPESYTYGEDQWNGQGQMTRPPDEDLPTVPSVFNTGRPKQTSRHYYQSWARAFYSQGLIFFLLLLFWPYCPSSITWVFFKNF